MTNKSWFALGIGKKNKKGEYLDMYFHPDHISSSETKLEKSSEYELVEVSDDLPPSSVQEAYLKLHLISLRLIKPNQTNLREFLEFFLMWLGHLLVQLMLMNSQKK